MEPSQNGPFSLVLLKIRLLVHGQFSPGFPKHLAFTLWNHHTVGLAESRNQVSSRSIGLHDVLAQMSGGLIRRM